MRLRVLFFHDGEVSASACALVLSLVVSYLRLLCWPEQAVANLSEKLPIAHLEASHRTSLEIAPWVRPRPRIMRVASKSPNGAAGSGQDVRHISFSVFPSRVHKVCQAGTRAVRAHIAVGKIREAV